MHEEGRHECTQTTRRQNSEVVVDKTARVESCAFFAPVRACDGDGHAEIMQESWTLASGVEQEVRYQASGGTKLMIGVAR